MIAARRLLRNEWVRAFLIALGLLLLLHVFVFRFVTVRSVSMWATLRPGDLLLVQRWPLWTGFERGDVVVFRDPLRDKEFAWRRPLLVKRIVGLPGDVVEIAQGRLLVNGKPVEEPGGMTTSHLIRLREDADAIAFAHKHGLPDELVIPGRSTLETALNDELSRSLEQDPEVVGIAPMRLASGAPSHIFPFSPRYAWNGDDYGPIIIPKKGDVLGINVDNLPAYDRLMSVYEGHALSNSGNQLLIDGQLLDRYTVEQDYCFVLGDSRHFSADSRYWGFLPMSHIVGRGGPVLLSQRRPADGDRGDDEE